MGYGHRANSLLGFSRQHGIGDFACIGSASRLGVIRLQLSSEPTYTLTPGQPSPGLTYPPASPISYPPSVGRFAVPKDITKYYNVKWTFAVDGTVLDSRPKWLTDQYAKTLIDNPRIQAEAKRGQPVYAQSHSQPPNAYGSGLMLGSDGAALPRIGAPLGE